MTVEREEELGLLIAVCDRCGERTALDVDIEAEQPDVDELIEQMGWRRDKPDRHRFPDALGKHAVVSIYEQDFCTDCQSDEIAPKPKRGSGRFARPARDAFDNDPCDDWPRSAIFEAAGLRPACGHSKIDRVDFSTGKTYSDPTCSFCEAGYSIGSNKPEWRR